MTVALSRSGDASYLPRSVPATATIPRIVVSAASSGAGKTTISLGIIGALQRRGLRVTAAKCGPDFIDAAHLARASSNRGAQS